MRCKQRRKPSRASPNNDHTCAIETQCHLLWRSRNAATPLRFFRGKVRQDTVGSLGQLLFQGDVQLASCLRSLRCNWSSVEGFSRVDPLCSNQKVLWPDIWGLYLSI